jgi:hypothetical protein
VSDETATAAIKERDDEIARLTAKVAELSNADAERETESKVTAARAEEQAKFSDLQGQYDALVLEAAASKKSYDDLVNLITEEATRQDAEAAAEARKATRLEQVKPFETILPANYVEQNTERLVAMDEESFTALLDGWKVVAGDRIPETSTIPSKTALQATSEGWQSRPGVRASADNKALLDAKSRGIDIRKV